MHYSNSDLFGLVVFLILDAISKKKKKRKKKEKISFRAEAEAILVTLFGDNFSTGLVKYI